MNKLYKLRKKIDVIDHKILKLINQRAELVKKIGKIKKEINEPLFSPSREEDIIKRIVSENKGVLSSEMVRKIFQQIIESCRILEEEIEKEKQWK